MNILWLESQIFGYHVILPGSKVERIHNLKKDVLTQKRLLCLEGSHVLKPSYIKRCISYLVVPENCLMPLCASGSDGTGGTLLGPQPALAAGAMGTTALLLGRVLSFLADASLRPSRLALQARDREEVPTLVLSKHLMKDNCRMACM